MNTDDFTRRAMIDSPGNDSPENNLEWRAFRYVLGEMSPAEADAFEEVLATDQETRELVARSTGLVTNLLDLSVLEATPTDSHNGSTAVGLVGIPTAWVRPAESPEFAQRELAGRRPRRFSGWAITGLAAAVCCCIAVGLSLLPLRGRTGLEDIHLGDVPDSGAGHLVAIWSQRLAELAPEIATTEPAASERSERAPAGRSR